MKSALNMWKVFIYYTESVLLHKLTDTDKNNKTQQLSSTLSMSMKFNSVRIITTTLILSTERLGLVINKAL